MGFISALIDAVANKYTVDRKRVYVTGASNGAMMSFRLACELTHKITAIAPVIGSFGENISKTCTPSRPIPVLIIGINRKDMDAAEVIWQFFERFSM